VGIRRIVIQSQLGSLLLRFLSIDKLDTVIHDPVSGWWYQYMDNMDQPTRNTLGYQGHNVYKSADLRNWKYVANICGPAAGEQLGVTAKPRRIQVLYNSLNHNYVAWKGTETVGLEVCTSPNPEAGPWTLVTTYATMFDGNSSPFGDIGSFVDSDGSAYLIYNYNTNANTAFSKLNSSYINADGVNHSTYSTIGEAHTMFKRGSVYFYLY
jgi:hypothetical protein